MAWQNALAIGLMSGIAVLGFLAGLTGAALARLFTAVIATGYVTLLLVTGVYVASCSDCTLFRSADSAQTFVLDMAIYFGGLVTVAILGLAWLGYGVSLLLTKVVGTRLTKSP